MPLRERRFLNIKSVPSILRYLKAQALRGSLNQGNGEDKYRRKLGKRELLVFHSKPLRWSFFNNH